MPRAKRPKKGRMYSQEEYDGKKISVPQARRTMANHLGVSNAAYKRHEGTLKPQNTSKKALKVGGGKKKTKY